MNWGHVCGEWLRERKQGPPMLSSVLALLGPRDYNISRKISDVLKFYMILIYMILIYIDKILIHIDSYLIDSCLLYVSYLYVLYVCIRMHTYIQYECIRSKYPAVQYSYQLTGTDSHRYLNIDIYQMKCWNQFKNDQERFISYVCCKSTFSTVY